MVYTERMEAKFNHKLSKAKYRPGQTLQRASAISLQLGPGVPSPEAKRSHNAVLQMRVDLPILQKS